MDVLKEFALYLCTEKELKESTVHIYVNDVKMILSELDKDIRSVSKDDIIALSERLRATKSAASIARAICSTRIFFSFLKKSGICETNPLDEVHFTYNRQGKKASSADIEKLVEASGGKTFTCMRDRAVLELLSTTKIKQTELMDLRVRDADILNRKIQMPNGKEITLNASAVAALNDYLMYILLYKHARPDSPLIMNAEGDRLSRQGYWKIVKKIARQAGLDAGLSPVLLREKYAQGSQDGVTA